jgi:hypothetical protein
VDECECEADISMERATVEKSVNWSSSSLVNFPPQNVDDDFDLDIDLDADLDFEFDFDEDGGASKREELGRWC